jgi:hypothetical protein
MRDGSMRSSSLEVAIQVVSGATATWIPGDA